MAEIKSTLDLVMERTRNLTLSDEEKAAKNQEEFRKRLQGLVKRCLEGTIKQEEMRRDLSSLQDQYAISDDAFVCREIIDQIDFDLNNSPILAFLKAQRGIDTEPLETLLAAYKSESRKAVADRMKDLKKELARNRGIRGSAVIPNPRADRVWKDNIDQIRADFTARLAKEKDLICS